MEFGSRLDRFIGKEDLWGYLWLLLNSIAGVYYIRTPAQQWSSRPNSAPETLLINFLYVENSTQEQLMRLRAQLSMEQDAAGTNTLTLEQESIPVSLTLNVSHRQDTTFN